MKHFSFKMVVLFITIVSVYSAVNAGKWKCDKKDKQSIDQLVAQIMIIGRSDQRFPEDLKKVKQFCEYVFYVCLII